MLGTMEDSFTYVCYYIFHEYGLHDIKSSRHYVYTVHKVVIGESYSVCTHFLNAFFVFFKPYFRRRTIKVNQR